MPCHLSCLSVHLDVSLFQHKESRSALIFATHLAGCAQDDASAIQAAIDDAQRTAQAVLIPAGVYALRAPLLGHCSNSKLQPGEPLIGPARRIAIMARVENKCGSPMLKGNFGIG